MAWFWLALAGALSWGISYAFVEKVLKTVDLFSFMLANYILGTIFFLTLFYFGTPHKKAAFKTLFSAETLPYFSVTFVFFMLGNLAIYGAISRHNATEVNLIEITYPLFTCLIAWLIFKTYTPHWGSFAALSLILAGVATLYLTTPR